MSESDKIIKICGLKTPIEAQKAIDSGANLLGAILVPNRSRTIEISNAIKISEICKSRRKKLNRKYQDSKELMKYLNSRNDLKGSNWFKHVSETIINNGPFFVGVFRNQSIEDILKLNDLIDLDIVQLHGSENFEEYIDKINLPIIPRYVLTNENIKDAVITNRHLIPLLDSELGGEGKLINWEDAVKFSQDLNGRYILAGGLTPENVSQALLTEGCLGVDVSGGVETNGIKDLTKIENFILNAKSI
ncbi:isomerase activity protein [[Candida] boidinii]|nr:isomerase activity protein [[Candida] boidinii]OWB63899.1 isomerase activity protein [[Candida] boidinii]OWB75094.1 isomerase activity protein [[Candida] boidinii]OWB80102.1 isomerase activity protein [[Candida] boidinii]